MSEPDDIQVTRPYQDHYARVYFRVLDDEQVNGTTLATYVALARYADWTDGTCRVSRPKLAKTARLSVRALDGGVKTLVRLGYLAVTRVQRADGSWSSSTYQLLDTAVAQAAVDAGQIQGVVHTVHQGGSAGDAPGGSAGGALRVVQGLRGGSAGPAHRELETTNKKQVNEKDGELAFPGPDADAQVVADPEPEPTTRRRRRTRLDPDWWPAAAVADEIAFEVGVTREQLAAWHRDFTDYWIGKGDPHADWTATWRRWMREQGRRHQAQTSRAGRGHAPADPAMDVLRREAGGSR